VVPCQRCGATLDPSARSCPYCGTTTAHAYALDQQREAQAFHAQQHAQASARARAEQEIVKQARIGLIVTALGFFICCLPVSMAGLALSVRAKMNARRYQLIAPPTSTLGLVLGIFGTLAVMALWVNYIFFVESKEERRAELDRRAAMLSLTKETACEIVKERLEDEGYKTDPNVFSPTCNGALERRSDRATLEGVSFDIPGKQKVTITACFARGQRWEVVELSEDGTCGLARADAGAKVAEPVPVDAAPSASARSIPRPKRR